jgi:hypothetical protein
MNTIRNVLVVAWKEIQIIVKDRGSLAILFVLPLVISSLYGAMNQTFASEDKEASILLDVSLVNADGGIYGDQVAGALEDISVLRLETLSPRQSSVWLRARPVPQSCCQPASATASPPTSRAPSR